MDARRLDKPGIVRNRRQALAFVPAVLLATAACRSVQIDAALRSPSDLAATATTRNPAYLGKLAYIQGGDIWIKTLPDGPARRLTTDGRNREPLWSPSGAWLAFRKDLGVASLQQLWVIRDSGSDARSVGVVRADLDGQFAWDLQPGTSIDRLAFVQGGGLALVDADGTDQRSLVSGSSSQNSGVQTLAWSPDGSWISFQKTDTTSRRGPNGESLQRTAAAIPQSVSALPAPAVSLATDPVEPDVTF